VSGIEDLSRIQLEATVFGSEDVSRSNEVSVGGDVVPFEFSAVFICPFNENLYESLKRHLYSFRRYRGEIIQELLHPQRASGSRAKKG
jgi:hypothetical protein